MNFFEIRLQNIGGSKYAWASGYGPIEEDINKIPFFKEASEVFKNGRREFWELCKSPPGIKFDRGGREWPDVLGCGLGNPSFFFSDKILTDFRDCGIPYLRATEMPLVLPLPKKLCDVPPPVYYVLEGIPGIETEWHAMGIDCGEDKRVNFSKGYPKPWPPVEWKVSRSSWTGLDLMSYKNWQMPMTLVCTDEIKDIAKARKWTNIRFQPLVTVS